MKKSTKIYKITVSSNFRNYLLNKYPSIFENYKFTRFAEYLLFSTFIDTSNKEEAKLIIPKEIIAYCDGLDEYDQNYNSSKFLIEYKSIMPKFEWQEATTHLNHNFARTVLNKGFDEEDMVQLSQNFTDKLNKCEKVWFRDGKKVNYKQQLAYRKETKEENEKEISSYTHLNEDQQKVINYLNSLNTNSISKAINKNIEKAWKRHNEIEYKSLDARLHEERILDFISENPDIKYTNKPESKTTRVCAIGTSTLSLNRELRKIILKDYITADLRASQFAILATVLDSKISKDFIRTGKSLWKELADFALNRSFTENEKNIAKHMLYGIAFGSAVNCLYFTDKKGNKIYIKGLKKELEEHNLEVLLTHPIIKDLIVNRNSKIKDIKKIGYAIDAYGSKLYISDNRPARACLASAIQSIELKIISSVFDVIDQYPEAAMITSFLHDGFTFTKNDELRNKNLMDKFQTAVKEKALDLNVITELEFE